MISAYAVADGSRWRDRRSWVALWLTLAFLVVAVLLVLSGWLVRLGNDHEGHSIVPALVQPGGTVSGRLSLTDQGLLPVEVSLEPRNPDGSRPVSLPAGLVVTIKRVADGTTLYHGPLTQEIGPLEVLEPGQSSELELTLTATDSQSRAAISLPYSYYWSASPSLPWWWWLPVVILAAVLTGYVYRGRPEPQR